MGFRVGGIQTLSPKAAETNNARLRTQKTTKSLWPPKSSSDPTYRSCYLGTPVVPFSTSYFGASFLKLNIRKNGALIINGLLGSISGLITGDTRSLDYLEGHGDLVSILTTAISHIITPVIHLLIYLLSHPGPPSMALP